VAKSGWTADRLRARARESVEQHGGGVDDAAFAHLAGNLRYVDGDYREPSTYGALRTELDGAARPLHYLAIPPSLFATVTEGLAASACARSARVVVEKPFGRDLPSAQALNAALHAVFSESDIFRIDHYLGKEPVQNLLVFRFGNTFPEPMGSAGGGASRGRRGRLAQPGLRRGDAAAGRRLPGRPRLPGAARRPGGGPMTSATAARGRVVFLLDVDNTLLDNDRVTADLRRYLVRELGAEREERYWTLFEALRSELGYADYLGALQRYRVENPGDPRVLRLSSFLVDYPLANRLIPASLDVLEHLGRWGPTVILSDGDVVFQPRKIERSGLFDAVDGRILVYIHKERELEDVERRFPAERYVLVDDKVRILAAVKAVWGPRVTTVFPRQGHYARQTRMAAHPPPDVTIERIGDLLDHDLNALVR
jgi:FMN phosphatase YigB (HAD superfamily)